MKREDVKKYLQMLGIELQQNALDLMVQYVPQEQITPEIMLQIELRFDE